MALLECQSCWHERPFPKKQRGRVPFEKTLEIICSQIAEGLLDDLMLWFWIESYAGRNGKPYFAPGIWIVLGPWTRRRVSAINSKQQDVDTKDNWIVIVIAFLQGRDVCKNDTWFCFSAKQNPEVWGQFQHCDSWCMEPSLVGAEVWCQAGDS